MQLKFCMPRKTRRLYGAGGKALIVKQEKIEEVPIKEDKEREDEKEAKQVTEPELEVAQMNDE